MTSIKPGSIALYITATRYDYYVSTLKLLADIGSKTITYTLEPGYIYGVKYGGRKTFVYAIPPHTIILRNSGGAINHVIEQLCREKTCYIISKPSWIKTYTLEIDKLLYILEELTSDNAVEINEKKVIAPNKECKEYNREILVVDGVYRFNYSWFTGRVNPFSKKYRELNKIVIESKPFRNVLVIGDNMPILYVEYGSQSRLIVKTCSEILNNYGRIIIDYIIDFLSD